MSVNEKAGLLLDALAPIVPFRGGTFTEADPEEWATIRLLMDELRAAIAADAQAVAGNRVGPSTRGSSTSRQAALDNFPRSGSQRFRVLEMIVNSGEYGATRDELAHYLALPDSGTDARVWELKRGGFVIDTERTRRTRLGEPAAVLVATPKAAAA